MGWETRENCSLNRVYRHTKPDHRDCGSIVATAENLVLDALPKGEKPLTLQSLVD